MLIEVNQNMDRLAQGLTTGLRRVKTTRDANGDELIGGLVRQNVLNKKTYKTYKMRQDLTCERTGPSSYQDRPVVNQTNFLSDLSQE